MELSGRTLDGYTVSSRGRWTVGVFWASWCGACRKQLPAVEGITKQLAARDVAVIGINLDDDLKQLKSYVNDQNISWPQISAGDSLAKRYGISSIPAVMLIDLRGKVAEAGLKPASIDGAVRHHLP
jgi:thiol-disulfide isomerase/thioredoxin